MDIFFHKTIAFSIFFFFVAPLKTGHWGHCHAVQASSSQNVTHATCTRSKSCSDPFIPIVCAYSFQVTYIFFFQTFFLIASFCLKVHHCYKTTSRWPRKGCHHIIHVQYTRNNNRYILYRKGIRSELERTDWFFVGRDCSIQTVYFMFVLPYNKLQY